MHFSPIVWWIPAAVNWVKRWLVTIVRIGMAVCVTVFRIWKGRWDRLPTCEMAEDEWRVATDHRRKPYWGIPHQTCVAQHESDSWVEFEAQVPLQVRRSGRDAANGVKVFYGANGAEAVWVWLWGMASTPLCGTWVYGVWGDFNVTITHW